MIDFIPLESQAKINIYLLSITFGSGSRTVVNRDDYRQKIIHVEKDLIQYKFLYMAYSRIKLFIFYGKLF